MIGVGLTFVNYLSRAHGLKRTTVFELYNILCDKARFLW